jgi:hypothetical protein
MTGYIKRCGEIDGITLYRCAPDRIHSSQSHRELCAQKTLGSDQVLGDASPPPLARSLGDWSGERYSRVVTRIHRALSLVVSIALGFACLFPSTCRPSTAVSTRSPTGGSGKVVRPKAASWPMSSRAYHRGITQLTPEEPARTLLGVDKWIATSRMLIFMAVSPTEASSIALATHSMGIIFADSEPRLLAHRGGTVGVVQDLGTNSRLFWSVARHPSRSREVTHRLHLFRGAGLPYGFSRRRIKCASVGMDRQVALMPSYSPSPCSHVPVCMS